VKIKATFFEEGGSLPLQYCESKDPIAASVDLKLLRKKKIARKQADAITCSGIDPKLCLANRRKLVNLEYYSPNAISGIEGINLQEMYHKQALTDAFLVSPVFIPNNRNNNLLGSSVDANCSCHAVYIPEVTCYPHIPCPDRI